MTVVADQIGLTLARIVLATDFSPASERATGYARDLARRFSSSLTIAHVIDLSVASRAEEALVGPPLDEMRHASTENLERLLNDMTSAGIRTTAHTLEAHNPAAALVGFAKELQADLLVVGTRGRHGLSKAILGSCAEGIIRHANCPVLTVGPKAKIASGEGLSFRTIVFATNFSSHAAMEAGVALSFAQDSVAKIYLCHVMDSSAKGTSDSLALKQKFEAALERLGPRCKYDCYNPVCVVENGAVAPQILDLVNKVKADLIVLGARSSSSWYPHLVEGTVGQVLMTATCPVMTICAG
jgi:nucleotide-binding universal stress UspA family protein